MFALKDLPRSSFLSDTVPLVARPLCRVPPLRTTRCYATGEEAKPAKAAKAPKAPKRPGTAYTLFVKEKYSSVSDTMPEGERSVGTVGKRIAEVWNSMSAVEKVGYERLASQAKAEYDQLNPKQPKEKKVKAGGKRISGYNLFLGERTKELKSEASVASTERFKRAVSDWKSLSDGEKKAFNDRAAASSSSE